MNYYKRHIGDYSIKTTGLTMIEHGAYNLMLDIAYNSEKPLPANAEELYERLGAKTSDEKWAVDRVIKRFFLPCTHDLNRNKFVGFRNKRVDEEIVKYREKSKSNQENGLKGGRPDSKNKPTGLRLGSTNNPTVTLTTNQEPLTTNHKPEVQKKAAQDKNGPSPTLAFSGTWLKVTATQDLTLGAAFPWVDRLAQYVKADSWLAANPGRRPRQSSRFMHNWFCRIEIPGEKNAPSKAQERSSRVRESVTSVLGTTGAVGRALRGELPERADAGNSPGLQNRLIGPKPEVAP